MRVIVTCNQQQLGLAGALPVVKRVWQTSGGRLAMHVQLPTPLAAQALARKRHRLHGTAFTVDLLRSQLDLATRKVGLERQRREQSGASDAPEGTQQAAASHPLAAGFDGAICLPRVAFAFVLVLFLYIIATHFYPP